MEYARAISFSQNLQGTNRTGAETTKPLIVIATVFIVDCLNSPITTPVKEVPRGFSLLFTQIPEMSPLGSALSCLPHLSPTDFIEPPSALPLSVMYKRKVKNCHSPQHFLEILHPGRCYPFGSNELIKILYRRKGSFHRHLLGVVEQDSRDTHPGPPGRPRPCEVPAGAHRAPPAPRFASGELG